DPTQPNYNPTGGTAPAAVFLNAGDVRQKGVEAELSATPVDGFEIDASLSYFAGHYNQLQPQAVAAGLTRDMELPFAPAWQGHLGVQYEIPLGSNGSLTPRVDYNFQSSAYSNAINHARNRLERRDVVNARLTYRTADGDWEAALAVT